MTKQYLDYEGLTAYDSAAKDWVGGHVATVAVRGMAKPDGTSIGVKADGTLYVQNVDVQSFLSAYPVGSHYLSASSQNPREVYGGYWEQQPSMGAYVWKRVAPASTVDTSAFLQAHPIGSLLQMDTSPATVAGTWKELPSLGARKWIREG